MGDDATITGWMGEPMSPIERDLSEVFSKHGAGDVARLVRKAMDAYRLDQRDRRIYQMRCKLPDDEIIGARFSVSPRHVRRVVKNYIAAMRKPKVDVSVSVVGGILVEG